MVDSRRIGAIVGQLIAGVLARSFGRLDRRRIGTAVVYLGVAVRCKRQGRIRGKGPPCIRLLLQAGQ